MEVQVGQFILGCKCPERRGIDVKEQDTIGDLPEAFFLQNILQLLQQRWVVLRVDSWALWKIINEEDAVFIPKNLGEKFSRGFLRSEFLAPTTGTVDVFDPLSGISGPISRRASACPNLMNDGPNPLMWDAQLLRYWFGRNPAVFQDLLVNLINNLWGGHCFWSSRMRRITDGKINTLNQATQFYTMVHILPMFPTEWREFPSAFWLAGKKKSWWELASPCYWNRARRLACFLSASVTRKTCSSAHEQTPRSTTLSILSYDVGK